MHQILLRLILTSFILSIFAAPAAADVIVGASFDDDGLKEFHLAIGDFYKVPEKQVVVVKKRGIPEDELPVVFYVAARSKLSASAIIDLRLEGKSWLDITLHCGLGPDIYYVEVAEDVGPPYGRALGHFKHNKRNQWHKIALADHEIVALVNLKFISSHYGYSPASVARMSAKNQSFVNLNHKIKKDKAARKGKFSENTAAEKKGKGKKKK